MQLLFDLLGIDVSNKSHLRQIRTELLQLVPHDRSGGLAQVVGALCSYFGVVWRQRTAIVFLMQLLWRLLHLLASKRYFRPSSIIKLPFGSSVLWGSAWKYRHAISSVNITMFSFGSCIQAFS